jgi:uncharacterized protein YqhQ
MVIEMQSMMTLMGCMYVLTYTLNMDMRLHTHQVDRDIYNLDVLILDLLVTFVVGRQLFGMFPIFLTHVLSHTGQHHESHTLLRRVWKLERLAVSISQVSQCW